MHSHQTMTGDVKPTLPQVRGAPGDMGPRQAAGWSCFGGRRSRVRIPPSRPKVQVMSLLSAASMVSKIV
jgi:hypothetical protein